MRSVAERANSFWSAALAALALVSLLSGCKHQGDADAIAKVNGRPITRGDVDHYYRQQTTGLPQQLSEEEADALRLNLLKTLIDQQITLQRAEKLGLLATDDEVEAKFSEMKAPYTQEQFDAKLKEQGTTEAEIKQEVRRGLTIEKVLNKEVTSKINVSDAEIAAYYNDHQAEFNRVEPQYHLGIIAVTTTPGVQVNNLKHDKAQNEEQARKKIDMLQKELDAGQDFGTLAMNYSEQPDSTPNAGDLGFVSEQSLRQGQDPAVFEAISKLKPGDHTRTPLPILDPGSRRPVGFGIFKLLSPKEPKGQQELSDPRVQQQIRQGLRERKEQLLREAFMTVARDQAKVENYYAEELLKKFQK